MKANRVAIVVAALAIAVLLVAGLLLSPSGDVEGLRVFTFSDSGVTFSGGSTNYEISGTHVTITGSGSFVLTGSCADGGVTVKKGVADVTLVLLDLDLTATDTAPIVLGKDSQTEIQVEGICTLTDGENPENETSSDAAVADAFEGAAVKLKSGAVLTLTGSGTLNVVGSAKNGIKGAAEATLTVDGPIVHVTAAKDGISCDGGITVLGGTVNVEAENDGIKADPEDGDAASAGRITLTGGAVTLDVGDDAIHAAGILTIGTEGAQDGPAVTVIRSHEGLEAASVYLHSGSGEIHSEDDAVNAGGSGDHKILVTGGSWYVDSDGDGLDANGQITVTGGTLEVYGAENGAGANTALDSDTGIAVSGGTVFTVDTNGTSPAGTRVRFTGLTVAGGAVLTVQDSEGNTLYEATALKAADTVLLAGDGVTADETYTLLVNGEALAQATAETGEYADGMTGGQRPDSADGLHHQSPEGMDGQTPSPPDREPPTT